MLRSYGNVEIQCWGSSSLCELAFISLFTLFLGLYHHSNNDLSVWCDWLCDVLLAGPIFSGYRFSIRGKIATVCLQRMELCLFQWHFLKNGSCTFCKFFLLHVKNSWLIAGNNFMKLTLFWGSGPWLLWTKNLKIKLKMCWGRLHKAL